MKPLRVTFHANTEETPHHRIIPQHLERPLLQSTTITDVGMKRNNQANKTFPMANGTLHFHLT